MTEQQELRAAIIEASEALRVALAAMDSAGGEAAEWLDEAAGYPAADIGHGGILDQAAEILAQLAGK
jgi:hypothetical protein